MAQVFQCDVSGKVGERGGVVVYDADPDDADTDSVRVEVCAEVWAELMAILKPTATPKRKRRTKAEIEAGLGVPHEDLGASRTREPYAKTNA